MQSLILASKSPRRKRILTQLGIQFTVIESSFPEEKKQRAVQKKTIVELVIANAKGKALSVASSIKEGIILGVDTLVVFENKIIGKPKDKKDALSILQAFNGKTHTVYSGIALIKKTSQSQEML